MSEKEAAVIELLRLEDDAYFGFDQEQQTGMQSELGRLVRPPRGQPPVEPDPILAIGGPRVVDIDDRAVIPVLVGRVESGLRSWKVNPLTNVHVLVRQVATGELRYALPLLDLRRGGPTLASGKGEPPGKADATSVGSSVERVDLRARIPAQLEPGAICVTAINYDIRSNSITMRLESEAPAPTVSLAASAGVTPGLTHHLDDRVDLPKSVEVPASVSRGDAAPLRVEIQVPKAAGVQQVPDEQDIAYWAANAVLVALDERPVVVPAVVPVRRVVTEGERQRFNASFELDLGPALSSLPAGEYRVYLDTGIGLEGPLTLTLRD